MRETNVQFTKNEIFAEACRLAGTPVTSRQASKYRRGLGLAIGYKLRASIEIDKRKSRKGETNEHTTAI